MSIRRLTRRAAKALLTIVLLVGPSPVGAQQPKFAAWTSGLEEDFGFGIPLERQIGREFRRERQHVGNVVVSGQDLSWAAANPGFIWVYYDEPDMSCVTPTDYASQYRDFVTAISSVDPTARFSPGGFAQPNSHPPCPTAPHFVEYARQFRNAYISLVGIEPPVFEWRFHAFSWANEPAMAFWRSWVQEADAFSIERNQPWVLGSFGFPAESLPDSDPTYQTYRAEVMNTIRDNPRIKTAAWWSLRFGGSSHYLVDGAGAFTPDGTLFKSYIPPDSSPVMWVDTPSYGATVGSTFLVAGWAVDTKAANGHGVDVVHVWAYPGGLGSGQSPQFLGSAQIGGQRPDVAAAIGLGPRFRYSALGLNVTSLSPGLYDVVVYARSTVTFTFNNAKLVRVTVQ